MRFCFSASNILIYSIFGRKFRRVCIRLFCPCVSKKGYRWLQPTVGGLTTAYSDIETRKVCAVITVLCVIDGPFRLPTRLDAAASEWSTPGVAPRHRVATSARGASRVCSPHLPFRLKLSQLRCGSRRLVYICHSLRIETSACNAMRSCSPLL